MQRFAFGAKCGARVEDSAPSSPSSRRSEANASEPIPVLVLRKRRRVAKFWSCSSIRYSQRIPQTFKPKPTIVPKRRLRDFGVRWGASSETPLSRAAPADEPPAASIVVLRFPVIESGVSPRAPHRTPNQRYETGGVKEWTFSRRNDLINTTAPACHTCSAR